MRSCKHLDQFASWRTTPLLPATAFSIYWLLAAISGGFLLHLQPEAMPCCGDRDTCIMEVTATLCSKNIMILSPIFLIRSSASYIINCMGHSLDPEEINNNCGKMTHMRGMDVFSLQIIHKARSIYCFILFLHKNIPHKKQHFMVMKLIFYPFHVISVVLFN